MDLKLLKTKTTFIPFFFLKPNQHVKINYNALNIVLNFFGFNKYIYLRNILKSVKCASASFFSDQRICTSEHLSRHFISFWQKLFTTSNQNPRFFASLASDWLSEIISPKMKYRLDTRWSETNRTLVQAAKKLRIFNKLDWRMLHCYIFHSKIESIKGFW